MDEACAEQAHELEEVVEREGAGVEARFVHVKGDVAGQMMRLALAIQADVIAVGRSTKRRQRVACSIGRRLTRFRNAPVVVIVP
jgi:nucleotide-binding universal stress UspA family protein